MKFKEKVLVSAAVVLLIIACLLLNGYQKQQHELLQTQLDEIGYSIDKLQAQQEIIKIEITDLMNDIATEKQEVRITSYYPGDSYGSGTVTASGLAVEDFVINEKGWFTYGGMLVMACATDNYNEDAVLPNSYKRYQLGDIITVVIDNVSYKAIIADICGASYWEEKHQRYDLFVSNSDSVIDTQASVLN